MFWSLFSCSSSGQSVQSKLYGATLKTLLSHSVNEVSPDDVKDDLSNYVVLDTREQVEYDVSTLPNAIFVGYDHFDMASVDDIPKDAKILLYCSVGYRSEKIGEKLVENGYKDVTNLYGGIFEWKNVGLEVVDNTGTTTSRVHAFDKIWGRFLNEGEKVY